MSEEEQVQDESTPELSEGALEQARKLGSEVELKYTAWREPRRPHELEWFVTAAYRHGKHTSETQFVSSTMQDYAKVDRRKKNIANRAWAKGRARFAKFARTRPKGIVVPFNTDRKSRLDARMTEHALDYTYERLDQEQKYLDAILWAADTGKSYWEIKWNDSKKVPIRQKNPLTGTVSIVDVPGGDIAVEVGSAFGMFVSDIRQAHLKDQPEIMWVAVKDVDEQKALYPTFTNYIKADSHVSSPFEYERQIARLAGNEVGALAGMEADKKGPMTGVLVKQHYVKPSAKYPQGRMVIVMNGLAVKVQDELPFGFAEMENPYPFVEFMDMPQVGQFYTSTFLSHLVPLQRGYNLLRDKLEKHIRQAVHMKWMAARQARLPQGALTNEAAEVVEWNYIPGMPEPHSITPAPISGDIWRFAQLIIREFDDVSQIFPSFEGKAGTAKSGIQTNLLQEASDSVHAPDARGFELAIRDAAYKFRRLMKRGYDVQRLISFAGRARTPEVFEFGAENIDEHATIVVQVGSALSQYKTTRIQQLLELHEKGLLGDPNNPELRRRILSLLDIGGIEQFREEAAADEDMARMENIDILDGQDIPIPQFYEDHLAHYGVHTSELKSPANKDLPEPIKQNFIRHTLLHMRWINPIAAFNLAMELGFPELIETGLIKPPAPSPVAGQATPTSQGVPNA